MMKGIGPIAAIFGLLAVTSFTAGVATPPVTDEPRGCEKVRYQHPASRATFALEVDPWELVIKEADLGLGWKTDPTLSGCLAQGARNHLTWAGSIMGDIGGRTAVTSEVAILDSQEAALGKLHSQPGVRIEATNILRMVDESGSWHGAEDTVHAAAVVGNAWLSATIQGKPDRLQLSSAENAVKLMVGELRAWPYLGRGR